jgi:hypothetical protein
LIAVSRSKDFQEWSAPEVIVSPDPSDLAPGAKWPELYNMSGFSYGEGFAGLLVVFNLTKLSPPVRGQGANVSRWDGPVDVKLVHSPDGTHWKRFEDGSYVLPRGPEGSFDAGCILSVANAPVIHGREMWFYYTGVNTSHGAPMPPKKIAVGRASWRVGGLVSLDASGRGVVETPPLTFSGDRLEVNVDASHGNVRVELLKADGSALPRFSAKECNPIRSDAVSEVVSWRGGSAVPRDRPLALRFHLDNAKLYGFRVSPGK